KPGLAKLSGDLAAALFQPGNLRTHPSVIQGLQSFVYTCCSGRFQLKEFNQMQLNLRQSTRAMIACFLVTLFLIPVNLIAQTNSVQATAAPTHLVSPADLQKEITTASDARQQNMKTVRQFLSTPTAEKAMKSAKIDAQQVKTAVATLDDDELAQLAARANKAQADFAAGDLGQRELIIIILAVAVLILIIVAVR